MLSVDWDSDAYSSLLVSKRLASVQLDAVAVLKIVKHCKDLAPSTATGQLLGIDVAGTLEVTNSFPFTAKAKTGASAAAANAAAAAAAATAADDVDGDAAAGAADEDVDGGADYQLQMLRSLRTLNFDANTVGWYQSTYLGSFWNQTLIETQYNHQKAFPNAVVVIYDPARTSQGSLALRALRLSDTFMTVFESRKFTVENLMKHQLSPSTVFESVPIKLHNSHLLNALLHEINGSRTAPPQVRTALAFPPSFLNARLPSNASPFAPNYDSLALGSESYLEKHLEYLAETIEEHGQEQWRWQGWQRSVQKEQQRAAQQTAYKISENAAAIAAGNPPPYSDDEIKAVPQSLTNVLNKEPSRLETLVITNQIDTYCKQIYQYAGPSLTKMFVAKGLQTQQ
ncbi:hypothetical protein BC831DRAFT_404984 [Entophlyctis helioformis]|nr:hypothetical protein BC831DRAFT_404984 [Entophlyctis helioformis]